MTKSPLLLAAVVTVAAVAAQVPTPNPQPRTAPRAQWAESTGVPVGPANRHWSPSTSNDTSLFVFGGRTGTGNGAKRNDLWELDFSTNQWIMHNADGAVGAPSQRFRNAISWDPANNRLVVFGGEDDAGNILGDTWAWDAATNTWTDITMPGGPSARRFSAMAYDPSLGGLILFGGQDASNAPLGDTWFLAGSTWAPLMTANAPAARGHHSMMTRPEFGDIVLCVGHDFGAAPNRVHFLDIWRFTAGTWTQIMPTTNVIPHGMTGNQAVYDAARNRVVLQGGQGISTDSASTGGAYGTAYGGSPSGWTSEFDSITNEWILYGPASFSTADPVIGRASRYYAAYIPHTRKVHMYGGQNPSGVGRPLTVVKEYQADPIASSRSVAAGCGGLTLQADNSPWLGRTHEQTVGGVVPGSLLVGTLGFGQQSLPLGAVLPAAPMGCIIGTTLGATISLSNPGTGSAGFDVPAPAMASLAGITVYGQVIQIELMGGSLSRATSSDVVEIILGAL